MNCTNCGTYNSPQSKFCIKCGNALNGDNLNQNNNLQQSISSNLQQPINNNLQQSINNNLQQPISRNLQQPINNNYINTQSNKPKNNKKVILIAVAILILIVVVIALLSFKKDKNNSSEFDDITYSTAFFLSGEDNKYALFNNNGKQLTEFIFTSISDFVNGTSIVKKDDAYGIIDSNGKMTVDFGKYSYISAAAGMYKVEEENYHYLLIDGTGKVLYDLKDNELRTFIGEYYSILEEKKTKTYKILNHQGKVMASFPVIENIEDGPGINQKDGYIAVSYNNKNIILNEKTGKEIISFNDDKHYCINDVEEDGKIITLNSCVGLFEVQDKVYYKFIKNGKLYDLTDKCDAVSYRYDNLVCFKDNRMYLLDNNLNLGLDILGKIYVDNDTYAEETSDVKFYDNGKFVKNVPCRDLKDIGYAKNGLYILETHYSVSCKTDFGTYEFYNSKGENAFGKSFAKVEDFDENGLAKVSEDKEKYYLIDTKGKKISDKFDSISLNDNYYIVTKDNLKGVLDSKGKQILDCKYSDINIIEAQNKYYAKLSTTDSKYIIYDLNKKAEILNSKNSPILYEHYILIVKDNSKKYYAYNGKLFYESK